MHLARVGEVHRVGEVGEVQAKRGSSDLNWSKMPRVISNRMGMFLTALLHTIPVSFVLSLHIFQYNGAPVYTNIPA